MKYRFTALLRPHPCATRKVRRKIAVAVANPLANRSVFRSSVEACRCAQRVKAVCGIAAVSAPGADRFGSVSAGLHKAVHRCFAIVVQRNDGL
jgi:hypothetical protein